MASRKTSTAATSTWPVWPPTWSVSASRYAESADAATLIKRRADRPPGAPAVPGEPTPPGGARSRASREASGERRAAQVQAYVAAATGHLAAGREDEALAACEHALLLDPEDRRAADLMAQANAALDDRQVRQWLDEARARLDAGALTEAQALVEQTLILRADCAEAESLRQELRERRAARELAAEGSRSAKAALARATRNFESGAYEAAARSATEVLAYDAANPVALEMKRRAAAAVESRRRQERDLQHPEVDEDASPSVAAEGAATVVARRTRPTGRPPGPGPTSDTPLPRPARGTRRRAGLVWAGPAAAAVIVVAGGLWFFVRSRAPEPRATNRPPITAPPSGTAGPGATPGDPEPVSATDAEVARIHAAFTEAIGGDDLGLAAKVVLAAPAAAREHAIVTADVDLLLATAKRRAQDAMAQAQRDPGARRSRTFRSAQAKQTEADQLERSGQLPEAALGFVAAADLFAGAMPVSQPPPLSVGSRPPVSAPVIEPPPSKSPPAGQPTPPTQPASAPAVVPPAQPAPASPPQPSPAPPASAPVPTPPPVAAAKPEPAAAPPAATTANPAPAAASVRPPVDPVVADTAAIREALALYVAGYERLDVAAIKRVFPSAPANLDLSNIRSYSLTLDNVQVELQGDRATVTAVRRIKVQMKSGGTQQPTVPTEFNLRRGAGGWTIERVR